MDEMEKIDYLVSWKSVLSNNVMNLIYRNFNHAGAEDFQPLR